MRLLRAELRKLRRPLVGWALLGLVMITVLLAWVTQRDVAGAFRQGPAGAIEFVAPEETCATFGLDEGAQCAQMLADRRAARQEFEAELRAEAFARAERVKILQHPIGAGRLAAGLTASLLGAIVMALMAAGHVGSEWSGKTIKSILAQDGRRWRFLLGKMASLWAAGAALLLTTWGVLAVLSPLFRAAFPLPGPALSSGEASGLAIPHVARALLVLAVWAAVGLVSAVVTRNALGAFGLATAIIAIPLAVSSIPAIVTLTPTYWVTGWMGFRDHGVLEYLWVVTFPSSVPEPSLRHGLAGLLGLTIISWLLSVVRIARADVVA